MKKLFLILTFVLFIISQINAQSINVTVHENGTTREETIGLPQSMTYDIDSLLNEWHSKNALTPARDCMMKDENPTFSDSVYIDRLSRIPAVMELTYNDIVRKFIELYSGKLRKQVSYMLGAANFYIPLFEEALDAYNIPLELKYLPIIESSLNPKATSPVGAAGLWQFMIGTGKVYGLESNSLVDERRDPIKSTWAAARYLRDLYTIYQDWNLVIAAYNCGPGNINKAIRRANGSKDYWAIYNYLPQETRGYVPAFIAANYVMNYYCDHNICPMEAELSENTDTVMVNKSLHFEQIADICGININQIRSLNPQYKTDVIPGNTGAYTLRLPRNYINTFIDRQDTIYNYRADELFLNRKTVSVEEVAEKPAAPKYVYHKVRKGQTLSTIAQRYGVSVSEIKKWNRLRKNKISSGKRLKIYK
ncbi:lytic transglycosylase domain-containing protein [Bacteroides sedimenti]|uniref:Lytic transglycosylase n=1 Tax=Bacteroides sedimenti TaxID=2136147 RepID=A0ABM8IEW1_9BACE